MALPEWLAHNLQLEEMNRFNFDPENRSDKCSDLGDFARRCADVNERNRGAE